MLGRSSAAEANALLPLVEWLGQDDSVEASLGLEQSAVTAALGCSYSAHGYGKIEQLAIH